MVDSCDSVLLFNCVSYYVSTESAVAASTSFIVGGLFSIFFLLYYSRFAA